MSDANYSGPLNDWMAQAPAAPPPQSWGKSLAGLLAPYLGIQPANDHAAPRPMTMAQPDVIGNRPDVQAGVRAAGAAAAEPFGQLGRVMTGTSQDTLGDIVGAAAGLAPIGPPGAKAVLGEVAGPTFSAAARAVDAAKMGKAVPEAWLGYLRNQPGVKQAELEHIGLEPWLKAQTGPVTKQEVGEFVRSKQPQITEVRKGGADQVQAAKDELNRRYERGDISYEDATKELDKIPAVEPTKYSQYQLPGGTNYGETLLTLPTKKLDPESFAKQFYDNWVKRGGDPEWEQLSKSKQEDWMRAADETNMVGKAPGNYTSSHWPDDPNPLLHTRHNDRTIPGPNGEPVNSLHLEELQSDWHQAGRKQGYGGQKEVSLSNEGPFAGATGLQQGVPDAPFKQSWPDLGLKWMLHRAATERNPDGSFKYGAMSWTPGEAQAARYDLSQHVQHINATRESNGSFTLDGIDKNGRPISLGEAIAPEKLPDVVGKELAEKIRGQNADQSTYSGLDLKVGGKGMEKFYDTMLPNKADALVKKYGAKTQAATVDARRRDAMGRVSSEGEREQKVHMIPITPELRAAAANGFPLFGAVGTAAIPATSGSLLHRNDSGS